MQPPRDLESPRDPRNQKQKEAAAKIMHRRMKIKTNCNKFKRMNRLESDIMRRLLRKTTSMSSE